MESPKVLFCSFGLRFREIPRDLDLFFNVRDLDNPYYEEALRPFTGLDQPIIDFMEARPQSMKRYAEIEKEAGDYLSSHIQEGKDIKIGVACTGGQHRSVYVAERLYRHFSSLYPCEIQHWEMHRYR